MKIVLSKLRGFYEGQLRLQQLYLDRHDVTGGEALAAMHTLRWSGEKLVGDWLPSAQLCGGRDSD